MTDLDVNPQSDRGYYVGDGESDVSAAWNAGSTRSTSSAWATRTAGDACSATGASAGSTSSLAGG